MPFELTELVSDGCLLGMVIHQYLASRNVEVLMSLPTKMPGFQEADYFPAGKIKEAQLYFTLKLWRKSIHVGTHGRVSSK